ncbi:MAG: topoisomerase DNA-binding C4 zinc finger domain-containing protein [Saccharofermentans sp.]|nr:topoisomerase DNA-binding C4 zinc finger domain-containing protein [Saccharofermentans sp.]
MEKKEYIVFDLETTGLSSDSDEVIEISALKIKGGKIEDEFSTLVDPGRHIPSVASSVNGITDDMVAGAPCMEEALGDFLDFVGDLDLVGHNIARFDMKFIQRDSERYFGKTLNNNVIDTLTLSRRYLTDQGSHSLGALACRFDVSYEGAHRALADCKINFQVYQHLLEAMKSAIAKVDCENKCPYCGNALVQRNGKHGRFWGCSSYPVCRYTRDY